jgi:lipopolysaccharide export system permease protein
MKLIDRYILTKFLSTFLFVVLILVAVVSVIDLTEHQDKFVQHNLGFGKVMEYYLSFIPWIANLLTPITV